LTALDANQIVEKSFKEIQDNYPSVSLKFGGEGERIQESMTSLAAALLMSVIGIFAILVFLFNSYLRPFIIMTTIPLGMVGVSVAFFVEQRPISFMAMIGIIGLGGIIVNSGIVLISFIESLKKEIKTNLEDVLVKASTLRLRAVVVTSITTVAGLLPTAYGIGGSDEFIVPLTLAMAWGLTSGTVLTLLWIPSAYAITEDMALFFKNLKIKKWQLNLKQKTSQFQEILK
jgi:multidrug efflux pump subunit AcrB